MDPIHEENGQWYFWDEVWADRHGPFVTEEGARRELEAYVDQLDGKYTIEIVVNQNAKLRDELDKLKEEHERYKQYWEELRDVADLLDVGSLKHAGMVTQKAKDVKKNIEYLKDDVERLEGIVALKNPCTGQPDCKCEKCLMKCFDNLMKIQKESSEKEIKELKEEVENYRQFETPYHKAMGDLEYAIKILRKLCANKEGAVLGDDNVIVDHKLKAWLRKRCCHYDWLSKEWGDQHCTA